MIRRPGANLLGALAGGRRGFARKAHRALPAPAAPSTDAKDAGAAPREHDPSRDWSAGWPLPAPRKGGFRPPKPYFQQGPVPRLGALWVPGEGGIHSPFDDPNTPVPHAPIEEDRPPPPWKVLRSHNGNLPVYTETRKHGLEVTTTVRHFFGDIDHMRKELMRVCESPVRVRKGSFEIKGLHTWKVKEWLGALGM
mmetsp:Transcript_29634/g.83555  ORF Transcript_29634/g.83555 Transcript_29634/m.83555 type:complete len:195 (-) Transcript_29634:6-590(-)